MGKPTKRIQKPKAKTRKKKRRSVKKADFFIPQTTQLDLEELNGGQDDLSFYSLVGHTSLDPYAWISLDDTDEFLAFYKDIHTYGETKPNVAGITSLVYKNEYKKFPTVEFEFTEPDFRKITTDFSSSSGSFEVKKKLISKRIEKMKYGRKFYIRFGYASSHVQYGPFTIIETDLKFEQGTAICKVKGRLGQKLRSISTVRYYSNTSPFDAMGEIANLAGLRVDMKGLLEDELEEFRKTKMDFTSEENLGKFFTTMTNRMGVELYFNPKDNSLHFDSPFKLELMNKGRKPIKMSYGFPSSSIDEIEVKVFRPKKKKRPTGGAIAMDQEKRGAVQAQLNKVQKSRRLVHGATKLAGESFFLSPQSDQFYVKQDVVIPDGQTEENTVGTLKYLQTKFKSDTNIGWIIEPSGVKVERDTKEYYNIYMVVATGEFLDSLTLEVGSTREVQQEIAKKDQIITSVSEISALGTGSERKYRINVLKKSPKIKKPKQAQSKTPSAQGTKVGDTFETADGRVLVKVGSVDFKNDYDPSVSEVNDSTSLRAANIRAYQDLVKRQKKLQSVKDNVTKLDDSSKRRFVLYSYADENGNPLKGASIHALDDTGSKQPKEFQPVSAAVTKQLVNRQIRSRTKGAGKRKELKISLRAGDWTMDCGRLIELTDVYHEYRGYYYVYGVEHEIGLDGFHTKLVCRVAAKSMVNKRMNPDTAQGTRAKKAKEAQTTQQKGVKITPARTITDLDKKVIERQEKQERINAGRTSDREEIKRYRRSGANRMH
tara:strand:+ start:2697 stop:5006 length:2310 start_codon:yes stop_codon:yes gene_type:complete